MWTESAGQLPPVPPEPRAGAGRNQPWEWKSSQAEVREGRGGQRAPRQGETSKRRDTEAQRLGRAAWRREVVRRAAGARCKAQGAQARGRGM